MTVRAEGDELVGPLIAQVLIGEVVDVQRPAGAALLAAATGPTDGVCPAATPSGRLHHGFVLT